MSHKKKRNIIIGTLCGVLLLMIVGYAAFNSVLNIKGTSSINSNWDVEITGITNHNATPGATNIEEPTFDNEHGLTATFKTALQSPGDYIEYDITIENKGTLDAILDKIELTKTDNTAILFQTSGINKGDRLDAKTSANLKIIVKYNAGTVGQPKDLESSLKVTLNYVQADREGIGTPDSSVVYRWGTRTVQQGDLLSNMQNASTSYDTLGHTTFVKHIIENGQVKDTEACFIKDNQLYCIKTNEYDITKNNLLQIFGEDKCNYGDISTSCTDGAIGATAAVNGQVSVSDSTSQCKVHANGSSECLIN